MSIWHKIQHKLGWWSGHVVSRTDAQNHIHIGLMCSSCSRVMSEHDATNIIDRHIEAHLIHNAKLTARNS
jgi:hypothetical protein